MKMKITKMKVNNLYIQDGKIGRVNWKNEFEEYSSVTSFIEAGLSLYKFVKYNDTKDIKFVKITAEVL